MDLERLAEEPPARLRGALTTGARPSLDWFASCASTIGACVWALACGTVMAPRSPGLSLGGNDVSDTIQSTLARELTVHVVSPTGRPADHQIVQFRSMAAGTPASPQAFVRLPGQLEPSTFVADPTDASGNAAVQVLFGTTAGPATIGITVPSFGFVDTASFTVLPGRVVQLALMPRNRAVYVGRPDTVQASTIDRLGNRVATLTPAVAVKGGPMSAVNGVVTASDVGTAVITASASGLVDTGTVTAVPAGTLAASRDSGGVAVFNLDGSGYAGLTTIPALMVKAAPSGTSVTFNNTGEQVAFGVPMYTLALNGNINVVDRPPSNSGDAFPSFSRDGIWILFSRYIAATNRGQMWRIHPDGSNASILPTHTPGSDYWPTGSPDGTTVAYVDILSSHLRLLTLATGDVNDLGVVVHSPQWSPTSNTIAFIATTGLQGAVGTVRSDGTNQRILTSDQYEWGIDWSPDGQWIVARNARTAKIDVINVTSGLVLPLPYTGTLGSPTWLPPAGPTTTTIKALVLRGFSSRSP